MDASMVTADDQMEASVTGSTGGTSSMRSGRVAKSAAARPVPSKYLQTATGVAPPTIHRQDASGRDLRAGASMGYASLAATPANALHGRSLHLASTLKGTGIVTRTVALRDAHQCHASPGAGTTTLTAASIAAPFPLSSALDAAAQERRKEQLAKYKQEKAARAGLAAPAAAPTAHAANSAGGAAGAPRVPALALGILRDGAQATGDGSRSARAGGVYSGAAGAGAAQMSARGGQLHSARQQAQTRQAGGALTGRAGGAAANTAKAPPMPRVPALPMPGMVEQQLRTAVNAPLPKDEVWEAAQVALPADGFEEGTSGPAAAKTPSSRITKSPRVVAAGGAGGTWVGHSQAQPTQQQQSQPAPAPVQSQQPSAPVPPRSPPPPSHRAMPAGSQAAATYAAGSVAADAYGGRMASNAEASTSDTSGRSIRDQIKMAKLQELQLRVLKAKLEVAKRARMEKGLRQLCAFALLLTDMMDQYAANNAKLAAAQAMKRTQHVLESQLPLLEQWKELQDTHGPATREVLTALQNAMTSLPLVNGAALGMGGGDGAQALAQLRRAIVNGVNTLKAAGGALEMLLQGVNTRASGGGGGNAGEARAGAQAPAGQGGVTAMATLLPQLHSELVGEVANMRSLLANLNTMAAKYDEVACLRARSAAAALAAPGPAQEPERGGFWGEAAGGGRGSAAHPAAAAMAVGDGSAVNIHAVLDQGIAMLGLGVDV